MADLPPPTPPPADDAINGDHTPPQAREADDDNDGADDGGSSSPGTSPRSCSPLVTPPGPHMELHLFRERQAGRFSLFHRVRARERSLRPRQWWRPDVLPKSIWTAMGVRSGEVVTSTSESVFNLEYSPSGYGTTVAMG